MSIISESSELCPVKDKELSLLSSITNTQSSSCTCNFWDHLLLLECNNKPQDVEPVFFMDSFSCPLMLPSSAAIADVEPNPNQQQGQCREQPCHEACSNYLDARKRYEVHEERLELLRAQERSAEEELARLPAELGDDEGDSEALLRVNLLRTLAESVRSKREELERKQRQKLKALLENPLHVPFISHNDAGPSPPRKSFDTPERFQVLNEQIGIGLARLNYLSKNLARYKRLIATAPTKARQRNVKYIEDRVEMQRSQLSLLRECQNKSCHNPINKYAALIRRVRGTVGDRSDDVPRVDTGNTGNSLQTKPN